MRRKDREVLDFDEIASFVLSQNTLRLALFDKEYPYIVTMNYAAEIMDNSFNLYIHSANEGKKVCLLSNNPNVCVEIDKNNGFVKLANGISVYYESFIGYGKAKRCLGEEKIYALKMLMNSCGFEDKDIENCKLINVTNVYKIQINSFSLKRHGRG